jgi:serine/threonine-protein kinase
MSETATSQSIDIGVRPGDVLAGKYEVKQVLGVGGMGVVVAAHHLQLDERVALKFLLPSALSNPEAISRFEREARAAVKIKSAHVARVIDVGKLESGSPYMVMEYLEGIDLACWLETRGVLPIEDAVEFVLQACEAIAEAHAAGIVHRDLKPANLFCIRRADGRLAIKVLDFGISKLTTPGGSVSMTRTTAIMGSPLYMSPEQLQSSKRVDVRTDIWALGIILFELITGRPPFESDVMTQLVIMVATARPVSVRSLRADVPLGLEQVIMRCLEKDIDARYRNVGELALALENYAPKRARASIETILGTMQSAGMSRSVASTGTTHAGDAMPLTPMNGTGVGTLANWGAKTGAGVRQGKKALAGVAVGVAVVGLTTGIVLMTKKGPTPDPRANVAPVAAVAAVASPSASLAVWPAPAQSPAVLTNAAPPAVALTAEATATVAGEKVPPPIPTPKAPSHPARQADGLHAASAAQGAPRAVAKVNCDPPYYYDPTGIRVFKKECL